MTKLLLFILLIVSLAAGQTNRHYSVQEIDALRSVCEARYLFGTSFQRGTGGTSRTYYESEKNKAVEEMLRSYMAAGVTAEDIRIADGDTTLKKLAPRPKKTNKDAQELLEAEKRITARALASLWDEYKRECAEENWLEVRTKASGWMTAKEWLFRSNYWIAEDFEPAIETRTAHNSPSFIDFMSFLARRKKEK